MDGAARPSTSNWRQAGAHHLPRTELSIPVLHHRPGRKPVPTSRFDGVKFGHRAPDYTDLADMYKTPAPRVCDEVKRRIMIGTYVFARLLRRLLPAGAEDPPHDCRRLPERLRDCDLIARPVAPPPWPGQIGCTRPRTDTWPTFHPARLLAGLPGMSIPVAFRSAGMPIGMQLIGNYFQDRACLNATHRFSRPPIGTRPPEPA